MTNVNVWFEDARLRYLYDIRHIPLACGNRYELALVKSLSAFGMQGLQISASLGNRASKWTQASTALPFSTDSPSFADGSGIGQEISASLASKMTSCHPTVVLARGRRLPSLPAFR